MLFPSSFRSPKNRSSRQEICRIVDWRAFETMTMLPVASLLRSSLTSNIITVCLYINLRLLNTMPKVSHVYWWNVRHFIALLVSITTWSGRCEKKTEIAIHLKISELYRNLGTTARMRKGGSLTSCFYDILHELN